MEATATTLERPAAQAGRRRTGIPFVVAAAVLAAASAAYAGKQYPSDVRSYRDWITAGSPSWNDPGPYPALVDAVWWPLRLVHADNVNPTWVLCWTGPATLLACVLLWRSVSRPHLAVGVWLLAAALLERSYWLRLEPVSAVLALAGVLAARRGRAGLSAGALTAGALVKVWPAFLAPLALLLAPARRRGRWLAVFAVPWGVYAALLGVFGPPGGLDWLTFTFSRPIQIESLTALGAMWAVGLGSSSWQISFEHGLNSADIITGPHLQTVHVGIELAGIAALVLLAWRLARAPWGALRDGVRLERALVAQAIVLIVLVLAGPVFSPQYMTWFAPVFAVAAGEGLLRREAGVWVVCCGLTALDYPVGYDMLREGHLLAIATLTARDAAVVLLLGLCWARLWRVTRPSAAGSPAGADGPQATAGRLPTTA